ncbi:MAG: hypothetical protein HC919_00980 [Oscillatoriales cyanobacterium SM2_2_1]|nr:hypothetical protein [Oscillatoriales cyanobacterium SM2_2_1]
MTNLTDGTPHPSGEISQSPEHVEGLADHADEFMDDLFGEVEYSLKLEAKQTKPRALSPRSHSQAGRALVPSASDQGQNSNLRFTRVDPSQIELPPISSQDVLWLAPYVHRDPSQNGAIPQEVIHRTSFIDRILLIAACSSVLAAGILWSLQYRQFESRLAVILRDRPESGGEAPTTAVQQRQFTEDIRRLLAAPRETSPVATAPVPTLSNVPTPVPGSNLQYLPLYQPPQVPP